MRKVIAAEYVSLDGVMEHPAWTGAYWDDDLAAAQSELMYGCEALLLGRLTYEAFADAWPNMPDAPGADQMNRVLKYVATNTLTEPTWNAQFLQGDVAEAVAALKAQDGGPLLVYGSGELLDYLRRYELVDEYRLMVFPLVLGHGQRLFKDSGALSKFRLLRTRQTGTGVLVLDYGREPGDATSPQIRQITNG
jgi:dihydrofolate reductase